jgi:ribonuclease E
LIPNKFIETPNYTIERLRHDDPRLEDTKASYAMADQPASESPYVAKKEDATPAKPRQEAVVKGITPATPAPQREAVAENTPSFWSKLFAFFKTEPEPPSRSKPTSANRQGRGDTGSGSGSGSGRGGRGGQDRRRERDRSEGKANATGESTAQGQAKGRDQNREAKEPREGRESKDGRGARSPARDGKDRKSRDRREAAPVAQAPITPSTAADAQAEANLAIEATAPLAPAEVGSESSAGTDRPRRRRRRGGRSEANGSLDANHASESMGDVAAPMIDLEAASAPIVPATVIPPAPERVLPAQPIESLKPAEPTEPTAPTEPVSPPVAMPAVAVHAASEPIAPAITVQPAPSPALPLEEDLAKAGLQWVQTDPDKAIALSQDPIESAPTLGRRPKRAAPVSADEPLTMVETKS